MVAVVYHAIGGGTSISTYNLLSGTHTYSHRVSEGCVVASIWTHDECFRFITMKQSPTTLTVWQVGFASIHTLTKVESFPGPGISVDPEHVLFLPTRSRFAFPHVGIWDIQDSLIQEIPITNTSYNMSFSSDGRFFVYTDSAGIHLWEESSPGYVLRGRLAGSHSRPLLSPNGKSITTSVGDEIQLWHTADQITSLSSAPTRPFGLRTQFLLDFSPDGSVAAAVLQGGGVVTVIDLKSGNPRSIIDTGMLIFGLRVAGNTITVFDGWRIVAWEPSAGDHVLDINDGVRTVTLGPPAPHPEYVRIAAISRDLNRIATLSRKDNTITSGYYVAIYDMSTGNHLVGTTCQYMDVLWITSEGCEIGLLRERRVGARKIIKDGKSNVLRLKRLPKNTRLPGGYPWESSHGYDITDDGWILDSRKKRVMWLPHHWRKDERDRMWDGRFLGLLDQELPEPIIIELGE